MIRLNPQQILGGLLLLGALAISFALKWQISQLNSLWTDELFSVSFIQMPLSAIWQELPSYESHPPLFYSLLKGWASIGFQSDFALRSLSISLSFLLVYCCWSIGIQLSILMNRQDRRLALILALFASLHPSIVWYATEVRPYMLFCVAYALLILGFLRIAAQLKMAGYHYQHTEWLGWLLTLLGTILTLWSHAVGVLFVVPVLIAFVSYWILFLRHGQRKFLLHAALTCLIALLFFIPLLMIVWQQMQNWSGGSWVNQAGLYSLATGWLTHFGFYEIATHWPERNNGLALLIKPLIFVPMLIAVAGSLLLARQRRNGLVLFLWAIAFLPFMLSFAISQAGPQIFVLRTLLPSVIGFVILLAVTTNTFRSQSVCLGLCIALCTVWTLHSGWLVTHRSKEPWQLLLSRLNQVSEQYDKVLLLPNFLSMPLARYGTPALQEKSLALPAPYPALNHSAFYPSGTPSVPGFTLDDAQQLLPKLDQAQTVLLITRSEQLYDPNRLALNTLLQQYSLVSQQQWGAIHLYHLQHL